MGGWGWEGVGEGIYWVGGDGLTFFMGGLGWVEVYFGRVRMGELFLWVDGGG